MQSNPTDIRSLRVTIAGVDATIRGPGAVLSVLERTLAFTSRPLESSASRVAIEVKSEGGAWRIDGSTDRSRKVLSGNCALPRVAGAVVSSLIADISNSTRLSAWRTAVVERDGRAVAFTGDDWESGLVLVAHLLTRGWRLIGGDCALADPQTLAVYGTRKLLHIPLSMIEDLPLPYRRAVEQSPWYSTTHDIAFYAVDPQLAITGVPWADTGRLHAVLLLDGQVSEFGSLERGGNFAVGDTTSTELEHAGVAVAEVVRGDYVKTCDILERWLLTLAD